MEHLKVIKKIQHFTQNYTFAELEERLVYLNTVRTFLYVWYVLVSMGTFGCCTE